MIESNGKSYKASANICTSSGFITYFESFVFFILFKN